MVKISDGVLSRALDDLGDASQLVASGSSLRSLEKISFLAC